jgi:Domain of unknown function (DUF397)
MDLTSAVWRRSTYSVNGNCVEVAYVDSQIVVRDSKHRAGSVLMFTLTEWHAFLDGVRDGEFDLTG